MKHCFVALILALSLVSCVNEDFQAVPDVQAEAAAQEALYAKGATFVDDPSSAEAVKLKKGFVVFAGVKLVLLLVRILA